jgi:pyruvate,water dikinase
VGGKARNLGRLVELGLPVPPWFCITTAVYANVLRDLEDGFAAQLSGLDCADPAAVRATAQQFQCEIRARSLPPTDEQELLARFDAAFGPDARVAVRSSAVGEDSASDSFAGQMDSYLFVTRSDLARRVLACFASAYSERALRYRHARKRPNARARVAVIVQQMIDSRVSGILFTRDPTAAGSAQAMVSAAFGLGDGIVSGKVESDTFLVSVPSGEVVSRQIGEKKARVVFDAAVGHGTALEDVPVAQRKLSTLTPDSLRVIVETGQRLERSFGAPQDIEWALDQAGSFYLLQARPITTLPSGRETIFDNANIVESFPGLSLPLTFSFARAAYEIVLVEASRRYGVPEKLLARFRPSLHANLVALIRGRMYYNLRNWYRLIEILPGCEWMLPGWEEALGIAPVVTRRKVTRSPRQHLALALGKARVYARFVRELFFLERDVERMRRLVQEALADLSARDLAALDAHALLELSESLMSELFEPYAIQNSNDDAAQQFFALLGRLIRRWHLGGDDLRNDLVSGETGLESLEPARSLLNLTAEVSRVPRLRSLFAQAQSNAAVWELLGRDADPAVTAFRQLASRHIELFGDRVLRELKIETPTLEANPAALVAMIRNHLQAGSNIKVVEARELEMRKRAERAVRKRLRGHPIRRWVFHFVLVQTRRTVSNREALRLARSRAVGIFKRIFRQIGCRFVDQGLIGNVQDLFYLTLEEIEGAIRGANLVRDLEELIALRKRDYQQYGRETADSRIVTRGIVQGTLFGAKRTASSAGDADGRPGPIKDELHGIGCSSGRVAARAMIVLDPRDDLEVRGRILVTQTTDPGWVFLMVAAAGLVAEKGSPLSHTAIIGRELGIPTIVDVEDATRRIGDGENIEMDGRKGTIRRLPD